MCDLLMGISHYRIREEKIYIVNVPANMIKFYQPFDLMLSDFLNVSSMNGTRDKWKFN